MYVRQVAKPVLSLCTKYLNDLPMVALGLEIAVQPAERTAQRRWVILDDGGLGHAQQQVVKYRHTDRVEHYG